jgi:hypothetical protein
MKLNVIIWSGRVYSLRRTLAEASSGITNYQIRAYRHLKNMILPVEAAIVAAAQLYFPNS